jgi:hypothetical protein
MCACAGRHHHDHRVVPALAASLRMPIRIAAERSDGGSDRRSGASVPTGRAGGGHGQLLLS